MTPHSDPGWPRNSAPGPAAQTASLKRLLERFRGVAVAHKHVLVELSHYGPWQAARLGATRDDPVEPRARSSTASRTPNGSSSRPAGNNTSGRRCKTDGAGNERKHGRGNEQQHYRL